MLNIVFLDSKTVGDVENLKLIQKEGDFEAFDITSEEDIVERSKNKHVIITNKVKITSDIMKELPDLKLICVAATGINNVDIEYAKRHGINVMNVKAYSTESVAQLTFSLLLSLTMRLNYYDEYVKSGKYANSDMFTHFGQPFRELHGMQLGIIGLGTIGRRVAQLAGSFGMETVFYSTSGKNNNIKYKRYDLDTLLRTSDVVSIHAPLTPETENLISYKELSIMKPSSIILNTGRGGIVNEGDLARALNENLISGAGIDVMEKEPINKDNPLLKIKDPFKITITPHIAWASIESRNRLAAKIAENIAYFKKSINEK
jgi:lactate dehydrogenase-like 2-hydroxyacid dehydrogenase